MGLHRAGFDVLGIDLRPQPNYPLRFMQGDALTFPLDGFDFIWASPPCQRYSSATRVSGKPLEHPDLIAVVRDRLRRSGAAWCIENVVGAPLRDPLTLCGTMFGLAVKRHRRIETSGFFALTPPCDHTKPIAGVYGNAHGARGAWPGMLASDLPTWSKAMGIDWMTTAELSQAIPPAYSEFIGKAALAALGVNV